MNGLSVNLSTLLGRHTLTGVDLVDHSISVSQVIKFELDGFTLLAMENKNDGYRGMLNGILVVTGDCHNKFKSCEVIGRTSDPEERVNLVELIDVTTQKPVLTIGTDYTDHLYPCFVGHFQPENMAINRAPIICPHCGGKVPVVGG